jgi:hypothetical protein
MSRTGNVVPIFVFLLTLVIVAPFGAPGAGVARADDCKTCVNEKEYRATLEELAYYFDNLYITTYRTIMFRQISEARNLDVNEVLQRLQTALAFAKEKGGDGVEPVILLYADALGQSKREWWMAEASKTLGAAEIKYRHPVPYEAMLQKFLAKAEVFACVDAQCPSGQTPVPRGQVCSCTGGDTEIGHRPPLPISQIFLDFDATPSASVYATDGALSGAASEILRSRPAVAAP